VHVKLEGAESETSRLRDAEISGDFLGAIIEKLTNLRQFVALDRSLLPSDKRYICEELEHVRRALQNPEIEVER
jgi:hypothetical protein